MKITLRKKYILVGIFLIAGFLAFLLFLASILQNRMMDQWNRDRMDDIAGEILAELERTDWDFGEAEIESLAFKSNISVAVTDENYRILYSMRKFEREKGTLSKKSQDVVLNARSELESTGRIFVSDLDDDNIASFIDIHKVPEKGYVVVRRSVTGFKSSIYIIERCFVMATVMTLLLGIVLLIILSGKMVGPIREINRVTGQIAKLDFEEKAIVHSNDELGELAESVNQMSDKLKEALDDLQQDVENRKTLMRNISHELKTPIAVIMGYSENMEYIAQKQPEKLKKYCTIISREAERMDELIRQMLYTSVCEKGQKALERTEVSVETLFEAVRRSYRLEMSEHKGEYLEDNEVETAFQGDFGMLERALYNLVKNAVRYGLKDGTIRIYAWETDRDIHFSVSNEGSSIPKEEQEKIWDEFYKADRARTRHKNSFGIGLSIVKQTALAHGGGVFVKNMDTGVEIGFYIRREEALLLGQ